MSFVQYIYIQMKSWRLFLLAMALLNFNILFAQPDTLVTPHKTDLNLLSDFIDSLVLREMDVFHVPGCAVVIVQDSQEVFLKGYGYADVEAQRLVDIHRTGFRIASVTKTFTATAIMQLVQQGLIDLHKPISNYLPDSDFTFLKDDPFTIHQLLTHTAGIDFTDIGDAELRASDVIPLEEFVRSKIPDQVHPPGSVHSYSNFGYTLLGYLIQHLSGMSYEEYIRQHILLPLDMRMSSMGQPLEEPYRSSLAKSYRWDDGQVALTRDYTNTVPGGGMISTGKDMSRYLLMHLTSGTQDSIQILGADHHNMLTTQQYGSTDTRYGVCYSFFENGWTGRRSIDHSGAQLGFLSLFLMIPETGTGIFIAHNNRDDASGFRYNVARAVLDTMLHRKARHIDLPDPDETLNSVASNYTGRYEQMNYSHSTFEKMNRLFGFNNSAYVVKYQNDNLLKLNGDDFVMMTPELFHRHDEKSPWNVQFVFGENGKAERIVAGTISYQKVTWFQSNKFWQRALLLSFLLMFVYLLLKPARWIIDRMRKVTPPARKVHSSLKWLNVVSILFFIGIGGLIINLLIYQGQLADYGVPLTFKIPLVINTLATISGLFAPFAVFQLWKSRLRIFPKVWCSLVILAVIILAIGSWQYNMVGLQY